MMNLHYLLRVGLRHIVRLKTGPHAFQPRYRQGQSGIRLQVLRR
jgi:hypothetical protein